MSSTTDPTGPASPSIEDGAPEHRPDRVRDVAWTLGSLLVLGVVGGLVWQWVATPPYFVRTAQGALMGQAQLGEKVNSDGWFVVIGLVGGLVAGFGLVRPQRRDPLLVVVLGTVASVGAGFLALWLGTTLGHTSSAALGSASVGEHVTASLQVISRFVVVAWPVGFLVAAVASLFGGHQEPRHDPAAHDVPAPGADPV